MADANKTPATTETLTAGTTVKITATTSLTIGKTVDVHTVTAYGHTAPEGACTSGAIPLSESPTLGVVVGYSNLQSALVKLVAPGKSNSGRVISVAMVSVLD